VPQGGQFADYHELFSRRRFADFALIATPDALHVEPAVQALEAGYAVLLEKPMAPTEDECELLVAAAERTGGLLQICHVLRYAPLYAAIKKVIDSGEIGDIVTIQHSENVSYWHYAHSYCRGNWRNRKASSPMILAKACHDLDILYWLAGSAPQRLTSLERPTELCSANAPKDAPDYCAEGCPHSSTCPYDAVAMYRDLQPLMIDLEKRTGEVPVPGRELPRPSEWRHWPVSVITDDPTPAGVDRALRTTRYGRCVYRVGDNDQPSSQQVGIAFANGVNASFTMHSTSHREGRETRIDGTRGSIVAGFYTLENTVEVHDHKDGRVRRVDLPDAAGSHGGADPKLFREFLAAVRGDVPPMTSAIESLWSHRMAFAADRAAREGVVVEWK
jgi:predicted dehydrogenase